MSYGSQENLKPLSVHRDSRGHLFEILRSDDYFFEGFGQVYTNETFPGEIRAFHRHFTHSDFVCCVSGSINIVLINEEGEVNEVLLNSSSPSLLRIPPKVWHGWQAVSESSARTVSIVRKPFNPEHPDCEQVDAHNNPWNYKWSKR